MKIVRASALGMCFGVRDALDKARSIEHPEDVTIYGELVHNEDVTCELARRGFAVIGEAERGSAFPVTPRVMITAHGICELERLRLIASGYQLIDTTCPLVKRAHEAARALEKMGCFVLVIGRRGHVEIDGLIGDLKRCDVVQSPAEVRLYDEPLIGVVCQTTTAPALAGEILDRIRILNADSEIRYANTICRPTLDRQAAVRSLLVRIEALVVVGGKKSNNTKQLADMARAVGKACVLVQGADEIDPEWVAQFDTVGLTAGTSTPDDVIDAVYRKLLSIAAEHEPEPFQQAI